MTRLQLDDRNPMAPVLVPYLMRQLMTSEYYADGQRLLLDWDFTQPADSAAAAYFNVVWSNVLRLTFEDQLPEQLWPDGGQRWMAVVSNLLRQPDNQWWDDAATEGVVEDRDMILAEAMRDARDELTRKVALSPKRWAWGLLHHLDLENQSLGQSGIGVVEAIFNRGPFDVGGGSSSVDATSWDASKGYDVTASPSMRMVVDLDDLDRSRWVNLTGASGHVASKHYRDQTPLWVDGRTLRMGVQPRRGAQGERGRARARADRLGPGSSPSTEAAYALLGGHRGHRPVMVVARHAVHDLLGVEQHADEGPVRHAIERPVVGAAAAAQPDTVAAHGDAGDQHDVCRREGLGAQGRSGRFEKPTAGGPQAVGSVVRPPVEVVVGAAAGAGSPACRQRAAGRAVDRCRARWRPRRTPRPWPPGGAPESPSDGRPEPSRARR